MQKHGIIENGKLVIVPQNTQGAKPVKHEDIPEFDQITQAIFQAAPIDEGDHIYVGIEVREVEQDDTRGDEWVF